MIDVDAESIARGDTHICSSFTENANDVRVNACCLTKQLQSLLWNKVGYDFKFIEYTTESLRSCQLQQLHSLMIDVDAESIARGDTHICSSFTEKAIAVSMNACYGDMYEGDYQDGEVNRKGTCAWANSNIYEGDCKDDKRNGKMTRREKVHWKHFCR